jgi:hypothetical protein
MAMGRRQNCQPELRIETSRVSRAPGHPLYGELSRILAKYGFDEFVEELCQKSYAAMGRPWLAPGASFVCCSSDTSKASSSGFAPASEPHPHGRRRWRGKARAKAATYVNRRRIRGERDKALLRRRGERLEGGFAHCYTTGGMRRVPLRGRDNIRKRVLIQVAGLDLGLVFAASAGRGHSTGGCTTSRRRSSR